MRDTYFPEDKNKVFVYDNVLDAKTQDLVSDTLLDQYFPWHTTIQHGTVTKEDQEELADQNVFEYMQFSHTFVVDGKQTSAYVDLMNLVVTKIQKKLDKNFLFSRIKTNLQTKVELNRKLFNTPHRDSVDYQHTVMLYYVNDADTPTYIFKNNQAPWEIEHTVESKKGRVVIFDGSKFHAGAHPQTGCRAVINFNITSIKDT